MVDIKFLTSVPFVEDLDPDSLAQENWKWRISWEMSLTPYDLLK